MQAIAIDNKCVNWNGNPVKTTAVNQRETKIIVLVGSFYCWNSFSPLPAIFCTKVFRDKLNTNCCAHLLNIPTDTQSAMHRKCSPRSSGMAWHATAQHSTAWNIVLLRLLFFFFFCLTFIIAFHFVKLYASWQRKCPRFFVVCERNNLCYLYLLRKYDI